MYYYGYSSAPAAYLLIVTTTLCIGALLARKSWGAAVAVALVTIAFFSVDPAWNFRMLYSNSGDYDISKHLYVYHDRSFVQYW